MMAGMWRFGLMMAVAAAAGGMAVTAVAEEPQLAHALSALDDARGYLSQTSDNKGGHPQKAMALIAQAEAEIRAVAP
jgi:thioredoxin reductase